MSTKFFKKEGEDSDPEVSDDSSQNEDKKEDNLPARKNLYMESSSDEEEKRVVRSEKDKRYHALNENIKKIKDKLKNEDFNAISNEFDELNKNLEKAKKVIEKEGIPRFYVQICYVLEKTIQDYPPEKKKNLKGNNAKGFNNLKLRIKKNYKNHQAVFDEFKKHPVFSEDEQKSEDEIKKNKKDASSDESSDDDKKAKKGGESSSDESSLSEGSLSDSESSDEEDLKKYLQSSDPQVRRNYWLLRKDTEEEDEETKKAKEEEKKKKKAEQIKQAQLRKIRAQEEKDRQAQVNREKVTYTIDALEKKIVEIIERRSGKKVQTGKSRGVDEDLDLLQDFLSDTKDNGRRLEILMILLPIRFDYAKMVNSLYMTRNLWVESFKNLQEVFRLIKTKDRLNIQEIRTFQRDSENFYKESSITESFSTHFDGLDSELVKGFKNTESNLPEYQDRLRDQAQLYKLARDALDYFDLIRDEVNYIKFAFKIIEYTYSVSDSVMEKMRQAAKERGIDIKHEFYAEMNTQQLVQELALRIYRSGDEKLKIKTMMYQIYHHCINGRYHVAKDYLLMSHIPDFAQSQDVNIQTMYNRVLIQLGLAAFREGQLTEAYQILGDICGTGRVRELIAQGISKNSTNEKEERRRILPYHLHINLELIETIYLIASMLTEIPLIASNDTRNVRYFRKFYEMHKNMYGPAESSRERIIVAGRELIKGNWRASYEQLTAIKVWEKLPSHVEKTKTNLLEKVKEQAFKCFLFSFQSCYETLNIETLAQQFELSRETVQSAISKMVCGREIKAYLDADSSCLVFHRDEISKLESLALNLSEKITSMLTNNEKIMDSHFGNYGYSDKDFSESALKKKSTYNKKKPGIPSKKKTGGKRRFN
eukprot:CAMPEP_0176444104 /NCGR_PEP_ID=MMETSP0127-20121128/22858_1 /TAXON_ID=938130 /ORGANISM="Platyophrya macrostoma, Strain WH" /LENGTH=875 /DNA_ID=CAMNT_0017829537 /DNA_START=41 /DNA_END=2668 /DNA_ORIENTATION=-